MTVAVSDLSYLRAGDKVLEARVYTPDGSGPFPCVLDVHGGAWVRGDRFNDAPLDTALAERGYLVVAVDFRQPPAHPYPAFVADVNAAIRWLKTHAAELGGSGERIAALGSSSGGDVGLMGRPRPLDPPLTGWAGPG